MPDRRMKDKLAARQPIITGMTRFRNPAFAALMARCGYDCVCIDNEHYPFTDEDIINICRAVHATGSSCTVRLPQKRADMIYRALDMGLDGIYMPNVETAEEAELIVSAAKYPPLGKRGCCPITAGSSYGIGMDAISYYEQANRDVSITIMIESKKGHDNIESILEVPGIDVIALGPSDFSGSYGRPGHASDADIKEAMDEVYSKARAAGVVCETTVSFPQDALEGVGRGDICLYCDSDLQMLSKGIKRKCTELEKCSFATLDGMEEKPFVLSLSYPEPAVAEIAVLHGVGLCIIDFLSFPYTDRDLANSINAIHARKGKCMVRMSDAQKDTYRHVLDIGADGILVAEAKSYHDACSAVKMICFSDGLPVFRDKASKPLIALEIGPGFAAEDLASVETMSQVDFLAAFHLQKGAGSFPKNPQKPVLGSDLGGLNAGTMGYLGYDLQLLSDGLENYVASIKAIIKMEKEREI